MPDRPSIDLASLRPLEPADAVTEELVAAMDETAKRTLAESLLKPEYLPWLGAE